MADSFKHGIEGWDSIVRENGYQNIVVNSVQDPELRKFEGKSITSISSEEGKDEFTALLDFIVMCRANASIVVMQCWGAKCGTGYRSILVRLGYPISVMQGRIA